MIETPLHLRLSKCSNKQLILFMLLLCERMYPNYVLFCREIKSDNDKTFINQLNLIWESLLVKNAKINFDKQLEKLESIIPDVQEDSPYLVYAAIDATKALSELVHSYLTNEYLEAAIKVSFISIQTITEVENDKSGENLTDNEIKNLPEVIEELDIQWDFYRLLMDYSELKIEFIQYLKNEIRENKTSNIGLFLSN